jgi:hypothetical protein
MWGWSDSAHQWLNLARSRIDTLLAAVEAVCELELYHPVAPGRKQWHGFASNVAFDFGVCLKRANPGLTIRISNDGPPARYVAVVVPYITGEKPTVTAVARELQRQKNQLVRRLADHEYPPQPAVSILRPR